MTVMIPALPFLEKLVIENSAKIAAQQLGGRGELQAFLMFILY